MHAIDGCVHMHHTTFIHPDRERSSNVAAVVGVLVSSVVILIIGTVVMLLVWRKVMYTTNVCDPSIHTCVYRYLEIVTALLV